MGSSQRHEEGQPETSLGQCRWDLAPRRIQGISGFKLRQDIEVEMFCF